MSINRVEITGNLTRDPELNQFQNGGSVLQFGVAVTDRVKNPQTGQYEDRPNYIDCRISGKRAQALRQYLHKGMKVAIAGKLRWSQWQDRQTGQNRSKLEVTVNDIEFMEQRQQIPQQQYCQPSQTYAPQQQYQQPQQFQQPQPAPQQPEQVPQPVSVAPDAIPF